MAMSRFFCIFFAISIGCIATAAVNDTNIANQVGVQRNGNGTNGQQVPPSFPKRCIGAKSLHECFLKFPRYKVVDDIFVYFLPIIIIGGTIGNILNLIVFTRWQMQQTATYFYMAVLSAADLAVLYISAFRIWIIKLTNFDIMAQTDAACKIFSFLPQFSTHFSVWILVAMTVDRFIAVHMPFKAITYSTLPKARIAVITVAIIFILFDMPILWKMELNVKGCRPNDENWYEIFPYLDMTVYSFVPFLLLAVFNTIIARDMIHARRTQQNLGLKGRKNEETMNKLASKANCQVTSMLLFVTTAFLCFTLPICILFIVRTFVFNTDTTDGAIDYAVCDAATKLLMYLNHSCNFFLYSLVGKKFRMSLAAIFHCGKKHRQTSVMGTAMTQSSRLRFSSSSQRYSVNA